MKIELPTAHRVDRLLTRTGKGKFAFNVPQNDVHLSADADAVGIGDMVVIRSTEQGVGMYVGVVTQLEVEAASGQLEVSGDNFSSVLYGMALDRGMPYSNRSAGEIARQLLRQAQGNGRSVFLREGTLAGTPLQSYTAGINFGTQHLGSALDALAKRTGDEWWIAHTWTPNEIRHYLHWNRRRGFDRSATVYLEEGRDFTAVGYKRDALGHVRSVVAVGGSGPLEERPSVAVALSAAGSVTKAEQTYTSPGRSPTSALTARDEIDLRALDNDRTMLQMAAEAKFRQPQTFGESLAPTIPLVRATTFAVGDYVAMRFYSIHQSVTVRNVRVNAMQPDEATGEADIDVTV